MTNNVNTVEVNRPPIITQAMETRVSAPSVIASAIGSIPTIMVIVVMQMGFKRTQPASTMASKAVLPRSIKVKV